MLDTSFLALSLTLSTFLCPHLYPNTKVVHTSGRIVWLKGQYEGLAERNGIASPFSYARQVDTLTVEVRPLTIYDKIAGVI